MQRAMVCRDGVLLRWGSVVYRSVAAFATRVWHGQTGYAAGMSLWQDGDRLLLLCCRRTASTHSRVANWLPGRCSSGSRSGSQGAWSAGCTMFRMDKVSFWWSWPDQRAVCDSAGPAAASLCV